MVSFHGNGGAHISCHCSGRGTITNVYILNHIVQVKLKKILFTAIIDFRAAYDTIDRGKLITKLKTVGVPKYIVDAIEEVYNATRFRIGKTLVRKNKGLRQGCPLSPILYILQTSRQ